MLISRSLVFVILAKYRQANIFQSIPFFLNDQPIDNEKEDSLELHEKAIRFAERVLNGKSPDSLVFGIDAPWGTGKTSFVNFCCEYWKNNPISDPIVFRFEPLRYTDSVNLVEKFVTELINTIQSQVFIPSIRSLFSKYLRLLKGSHAFSLFGIKFEFESGSGTIDETLKTLEEYLGDLNRKIIIVVDDLDRLSWTEVKNILFAIKRSFILPNVSYPCIIGQEKAPSWLDTDWLLGQFGSQRSKAIQGYRQFVMAGRGLPSPMLDMRHQLLLGDDAFVERHRQTRQPEELREVTKAHRRAAAFSLHEYQARYPDRGQAIVQAYLCGAYTMAEIGRHFGVHYMTVSRAVRRFEKDRIEKDGMLEC